MEKINILSLKASQDVCDFTFVEACKEFDDLLKRTHILWLKKQTETAGREMEQAEKIGDFEKAKNLMQKINNLNIFLKIYIKSGEFMTKKKKVTTKKQVKKTVRKAGSKINKKTVKKTVKKITSKP